jgi:2-polyprenyl-6-methoxyphenol hydroxylase-like FAD-dependent oxidoreductase
MGTALALARAGHPVTICEQDHIPADGGPEQAFTRPRRGVPQARQTHGLLARLTLLLRERFPDVLDDLLAAGARAEPLTGPGDHEPVDDDALLLVRRTTLEWVLRRAARRQEGVTWTDGCPVEGLATDHATGGGPPAVIGVRLAGGGTCPASAVVLATGRRGDVPGWYAAAGTEVTETEHAAALVYHTRWYRLPAGRRVPMRSDMTGDLGYLKYLAVPCDGDLLSVTVAAPAADGELRRHLRDPDAFDRCAASLGALRDVFADHPLEPVTGVEPMGGFVNRIRRFTGTDGEPVALGVHAVGDAHTCTNPFYGRGCSLALVQAGLLADAFAAHPDPRARAVAYEQASAAQIEPWYHQAVDLDASYDPQGRRERGNEAMTDTLDKVLRAGTADPVIGRGLQRVFNLLALPHELMADPVFVQRIGAMLADPAGLPRPPRLGPRRSELLAAGTPGREKGDGHA